MIFKEKLNYLLEEANCTSKELSAKSGISETVISRYRRGERTPKENSPQLKKLATAITTIIKEQNIKTLKNIDIYEELLTTIEEKNPFNYDTFSKHLNELIITLKININEMSKYISFDASHISRIRYGKTKPTDPISLSNKIANFIESNYQEKNNLNQLSLLLDKDINKENLSKEILNYLTSDETIKPTNNIDKLLDSINNFNLNDYIKAIKFDELKVPNIPFYKAKNKTYYGLEEMKQGELDFFKATVLSKSEENIFMCSDMPMEDMAKDIEFGKKWMFAIAMCLKKGLHLNIIHNLDRPFNEMMLGLESWIPIYMTGLISPYYLKETNNNIYNHLTYVSGRYALSGECIASHHNKGKYHLTNDSTEVNYYQTKANLLLKKANSLMDIYDEKNKKLYQNFINEDIKIKTNRKRILNSLPLFTISDALLTKILKRNNLSEEDITTIKKYKKEEEQNIKNILKTNEITDIIHNYENEINNHNKIYLSLENIFYNKKIEYNQKEYAEHLNQTLNYKNKNYKQIINENKTFNNITITILEKSYVIISKTSNPQIHFIIKHPNLTKAISEFNPLIKE